MDLMYLQMIRRDSYKSRGKLKKTYEGKEKKMRKKQKKQQKKKN